MKISRWIVLAVYVTIGISAPMLLWKYGPPLTWGSRALVLVVSVVVVLYGVLQIYLDSTRPKEFQIEGATVKRIGKRDMLVTPNPLTEQEVKDTFRLCVLVVCCNPGSKTEISFATELFPCPQKSAYENRAGSLEISVFGRTMLIPNERGWQDDNPDKILIHRQFDCTPDDIAAFRKDPAWTQVKQQSFMA